jgi:hypothetical protein
LIGAPFRMTSTGPSTRIEIVPSTTSHKYSSPGRQGKRVVRSSSMRACWPWVRPPWRGLSVRLENVRAQRHSQSVKAECRRSIHAQQVSSRSAPVAQWIERRPPEPDRLSVVASRVGPERNGRSFTLYRGARGCRPSPGIEDAHDEQMTFGQRHGASKTSLPGPTPGLRAPGLSRRARPQHSPRGTCGRWVCRARRNRRTGRRGISWCRTRSCAA